MVITIYPVASVDPRANRHLLTDVAMDWTNQRHSKEANHIDRLYWHCGSLRRRYIPAPAAGLLTPLGYSRGQRLGSSYRLLGLLTGGRPQIQASVVGRAQVGGKNHRYTNECDSDHYGQW